MFPSAPHVRIRDPHLGEDFHTVDERLRAIQVEGGEARIVRLARQDRVPEDHATRNDGGANVHHSVGLERALLIDPHLNRHAGHDGRRKGHALNHLAPDEGIEVGEIAAHGNDLHGVGHADGDERGVDGTGVGGHGGIVAGWRLVWGRV